MRRFYAARGARRRRPGAAGVATYNRRFAADHAIAMEAEAVNRIANTLADLRTRTAELRRYL
jgi:hypothetical protein